ncbi:MAG: hypothetical protein ABGY43_09945, partial [bacterium]
VAIANPMPAEPPVIAAIFPLSFIFISYFMNCEFRTNSSVNGISICELNVAATHLCVKRLCRARLKQRAAPVAALLARYLPASLPRSLACLWA